MRLIILFVLTILFSSLSFAEDDFLQRASEVEKVCVLDMGKGRAFKKSGQLRPIIEQQRCQKGDRLYIVELQMIGQTQATVPLVASMVCDYDQQIQLFGLQNIISAMCTYSGTILPTIATNQILKAAGFASRRAKKNELVFLEE